MNPQGRPRAAFAGAIILGAFLLFQVQPIVAKAILPWLGVAPPVWTTSMLFFRTLLPAGYAYAPGAAISLRPRTQSLLHLAFLAAALAVLPAAEGRRRARGSCQHAAPGSGAFDRGPGREAGKFSLGDPRGRRRRARDHRRALDPREFRSLDPGTPAPPARRPRSRRWRPGAATLDGRLQQPDRGAEEVGGLPGRASALYVW